MNKFIIEDEIQDSESHYRNVLERLPEGIYKSTPEGRFIEVNNAIVKMLGYGSKEELLAIDINSELYFSPEDRLSSINRSTENSPKIFKLKKKDGTAIWVEDHVWLTFNKKGEVLYYEGLVRDITKRKQAEETVANEQILLRTLIDSIPSPIYVKDLNGQKIISNRADMELHEKYVGNDKSDYEDDSSVVGTAQPILNKLKIINSTESGKKYFLTSKIPFANESGKTTGIIGVWHDITQQKRNELKIIQLSKAVEQNPSSIIITDTLGNIEYVNPKFNEITGFTLEEVKGKNPRFLQSGETPPEEYVRFWKTITSGNEYRTEIMNKRKNGQYYWASVHMSPIRDEEGEVSNFITIIEDISERKKAELEIKKLSVAIEQSPASVIITNTHGVIEYVNAKFTELLGYTEHELIGTVLRIFKDGHTSSETHNQIWEKLFAGEIWQGEHKNRTKNKELYWESVIISPLKDQNGQITNFIVLGENTTKRKKMEEDLIAAKDKAEESDRLKTAFLANMSHEIRTPLNGILGFADLLSTPDIDPITRREFTNLMNQNCTNLLTVINDIMDISKIETSQITINRQNFLARKLIIDIRNEYTVRAESKGLELKINLNSKNHDLLIFSDEGRIRQIIANFLNNAIKFTNSGYIEIGFNKTDQLIVFYVKDSGIGIRKDFHEKIFERFRQVEAEHTRKYGGNGLGLAITKKLATLLGGTIWLESEPDKGSTFFFSLPETII